MGHGEGITDQWDEGTLADVVEVGDFFAVEAEWPNDYNTELDFIVHKARARCWSGYDRCLRFRRRKKICGAAKTRRSPRLTGQSPRIVADRRENGAIAENRGGPPQKRGDRPESWRTAAKRAIRPETRRSVPITSVAPNRGDRLVDGAIALKNAAIAL
ncbi:hypothetical protein R1sor_024625 [Riccia sorocarpa]|uniref:Uncharacterized protein n=1 Tax=Riccia sorocarpa TaxID=122646 RepID=A0ABD3GV09_9MARC